MVDTAILIRFFTDIAMFILIWLVQIIIYPGYHFIDESAFPLWHKRYMRNISFFVMPLIILQAGATVILLFESTQLLRLAELSFLMLAWVVTFSCSVPCHNKLQAIGKDEATIKRLIQTNWWRTIGWTVVMLIGWASV